MWVLPTRSRVSNFQRAVALYPEAPVLSVFTENDPDLDTLERIDLPEKWRNLVVPPDSTVPELLNLVFQKYPGETYYGFIGDDVIPPDDCQWWEILRQAAGDHHFAYPFDSIHGFKNSPHFCIGGDLVRAVGFLAAPWFHHTFIDTTWFYLTKELKLRRQIPDVLFDHHNPLAQDFADLDDDIYRLGRSRYEEDMVKFKAWMTPNGILALAKQVRDRLGLHVV